MATVNCEADVESCIVAPFSDMMIILPTLDIGFAASSVTVPFIFQITVEFLVAPVLQVLVIYPSLLGVLFGSIS